MIASMQSHDQLPAVALSDLDPERHATYREFGSKRYLGAHGVEWEVRSMAQALRWARENNRTLVCIADEGV